jgi:hypothetical protein
MVRSTALVLTATALAIAVVAACKPDLNEAVSLVSSPRVLAVKTEPAEARPKSSVHLTALYVDSSGPVSSPPIDWAWCDARKPLKELGPVNAACAETSGDPFVPLGSGGQVAGTVPEDSCRQFGPDTPPAADGGVVGRPVDPDTTGGYYQPARLAVSASSGDVLAISETRLSCGLSSATPEQSAAFGAAYHANLNPVVDSLSAADGPPFVSDEHGATNPLQAGAQLTLRASWASCPADATASCTGAESYFVLDLSSHQLVVQREGMRVSWFATGGTFGLDRTGRDSSDTTPWSENAWTAPTQPGVVHVWVVLRDDRGGVGWRGYAFDVR